jgi:hypothetical protein
MAKAIFDIAGKLDILFRIARAGNKTFTFLDADEAEYSLDGLVFELNVKELPDSAANVFQLTDGSGLTIGTNTIAIAVDEEQTDIPERLYFWELYETVGKKTWLCGTAYFISRDPSENDATTATVRLDPDTITVTISGGGGTTIIGGAYADQSTILGEGTEEDPFYIPEGLYDAYGVGEVIAREGLLRVWDNTENKFPDSGGSGEDGAIERHNLFIGEGVGAWEILTGHGSEQVVDGMEFRAKIDAPGQDPANWWVKG